MNSSLEAPCRSLHCHCLNLVLARVTAFSWELYPQPARNSVLTIIEAMEDVCAASGPASAEQASRRMLGSIGSAAVGAFFEAAEPVAGFLVDVVRCGEHWTCMAALAVLKQLGVWSVSSPPLDRVRRTAEGVPLNVALLCVLEEAEPVFRAAALADASHAGLAAELLMLVGTAPEGKFAHAG
ncbi:hypothetical protein [Ramlibacter humi]|uniref:Uncharacterized protein n=1 Tax=Ramlibacter humi TaxID=2530451 RepID=A0A4Z0BD64_9BURK|nr:hypothetical protein [Ramlibacter humi]TFY96591.1 hypothetical protein EZ216_20270 [Ramlibacter humi]